MNSREEEIRAIGILLVKAKELDGEIQELTQKFMEACIKDPIDQQVLRSVADFSIEVQELNAKLFAAIITIAVACKGLEEIRIVWRDFNIIDLRQEAGI